MSQAISAVVEDWIVEELDKIAEAENRKRSNVVETLLIQALKEKGISPEKRGDSL